MLTTASLWCGLEIPRVPVAPTLNRTIPRDVPTQTSSRLLSTVVTDTRATSAWHSVPVTPTTPSSHWSSSSRTARSLLTHSRPRGRPSHMPPRVSGVMSESPFVAPHPVGSGRLTMVGRLRPSAAMSTSS